MDCPTCGLINPPGASSCDCGYDFAASKAAEFPGRPVVSLAWRQTFEAYWSISWLAWIVSFTLLIVFTTLSFDTLGDNMSVVALAANLVFFGLQAALCRRLVEKNYRSFRVYVIREDGTQGRSLSLGEALRVWAWIFAPQVAFLVLVSLLTRFGQQLPQFILRFVISISPWLRFLVVGPYAVSLAMRVRHRGFRLQAYGLRSV